MCVLWSQRGVSGGGGRGRKWTPLFFSLIFLYRGLAARYSSAGDFLNNSWSNSKKKFIRWVSQNVVELSAPAFIILLTDNKSLQFL